MQAAACSRPGLVEDAVVRPVNAIQDVQQVQQLLHAEAEVVDHQHQQRLAVTAVAEAALAVVVQAKVVADQVTPVAGLQLAMLRRPLWFLSNSLK